MQLLQLVLIAAGLTALAITGYARIFPWVLSFNLQFSPGVLTPWIEVWNNERDGIEVYILYTLVFGIIGSSALVFWLLSLAPQRRRAGIHFLSGGPEKPEFAYPYAATIFTADLVADARAMLDGGYYLLMDSVVARTAEAAGLGVADYGYKTTLGSYVLIGKSGPRAR